MDKIRSRYTQPDFQFARFRLGGADFGVALRSVKEILRYIEPERSDAVPSFIDGFLKLRGMYIPAIDLRKRFSLGSTVSDLTRIIITILHGHVAGLVVDEVNDIVTGGKEIKLKEYTEDAPWAASIEAVIELGANNILILNPSTLLTDDEKKFLDAPLTGL